MAEPAPPPELSAVQVLNLWSGDVLALSVPHHITEDDAAGIRKQFAGLFPGTRVIVLDGGMQLSVVRKEDVDHG